MQITNTQIEKLFKKAVRNTKNNKYYIVDCSTNYLYCYKEGENYPVFSGNRVEFAHFLNCMKKARENGFKIKNYMEFNHLFGMMVSKEVYGGINLEYILKDNYIMEYDIDDDLKLFCAKYVKNAISNTKYDGTDGEGNNYRSAEYIEIN